MVTAAIRIGDRSIGNESPCYVIAEAGVNHNGDIFLAHKLVDAAADAGADAVKFQTFVPELLVTPDAAQAEYQTANMGRKESQLQMLQGLVLPRSAHAELVSHANERNIQFLSTPFDDESADFLATLDMPAFKVASGEITNLPFIARLASFGKPLLISSGMSTLKDIQDAVETAKRAGCVSIALFHCVSNYPTAPIDCNLKAIETIRDHFKVPTGWSDHTEGIAISLAAAARGAELIEKHLTLDRTMSGPDHKASLEPSELKELVLRAREIQQAIGNGSKNPRNVELPIANLVRKGLYFSRAFPKGHIVAPNDVVARRPQGKFAPSEYWSIVGKVLAKEVKESQPVDYGDFE